MIEIEREPGVPDFDMERVDCPKCGSPNAFAHIFKIGRLTMRTVICNDCGAQQDDASLLEEDRQN